MKALKLKVTLVEETLGGAPGDPEVYENYIIQNKLMQEDRRLRAAKTEEEIEAAVSDARKRADEELEALRKKMEEEGVEDTVEKGSTVFLRDDDGTPLMWDHQIKGFLKEAIDGLRNINGSFLDDKAAGSSKEKDDGEAEKTTKKAAKKKTRAQSLGLGTTQYKKTIDRQIFVEPRRIRLQMPEGSEVTWCERPIRVTTMQGERVALARSEAVPAGTTFEITISIYNHKLVDVVKQALMYGRLKGLGQWRSGGKGSFEVELLEETTADCPSQLDITKMKRRETA